MIAKKYYIKQAADFETAFTVTNNLAATLRLFNFFRLLCLSSMLIVCFTSSTAMGSNRDLEQLEGFFDYLVSSECKGDNKDSKTGFCDALIVALRLGFSPYPTGVKKSVNQCFAENDASGPPKSDFDREYCRGFLYGILEGIHFKERIKEGYLPYHEHCDAKRLQSDIINLRKNNAEYRNAPIYNVILAANSQCKSAFPGEYAYNDPLFKRLSIEPLTSVYDAYMGLYAIADQTGKKHTQPLFNNVFWGSQSAVLTVGKQKGLIGENGNWILQPVYLQIRVDQEQLIQVQNLDGKWALFTLSGAQFTPFKFDDLRSFGNGLAPARVEGKYGFIDKNGSTVILFKYDNANSFEYGLASVKLENYTGMINSRDEIVVDFEYEYAYASENLIIAKHKDGYGLFNTAGKPILEPKYPNISINSELALVELSNKKKGLMDDRGNWVVQPVFNQLNLPNEGLASASTDGRKWGYIDLDANWVIEPRYDYTYAFSDGLAAAKISDKWGYVNKSGKPITHFDYDKAQRFQNGRAEVSIKHKCIDKTWFNEQLILDESGNVIERLNESELKSCLTLPEEYRSANQYLLNQCEKDGGFKQFQTVRDQGVLLTHDQFGQNISSEEIYHYLFDLKFDYLEIEQSTLSFYPWVNVRSALPYLRIRKADGNDSACVVPMLNRKDREGIRPLRQNSELLESYRKDLSAKGLPEGSCLALDETRTPQSRYKLSFAKMTSTGQVEIEWTIRSVLDLQNNQTLTEFRSFHHCLSPKRWQIDHLTCDIDVNCPTTVLKDDLNRFYTESIKPH
jgi:hypothetical protein